MSTEQQILNLIRNMIPDSQRYLYDDAAIVEDNLILTTDALVEHTHFTLKSYTPEEIGWKALAVNLSDIAAMGGKPLYALISLSCPKNIKLNWIKEFCTGLLKCAKKYKTKIIGGNLSKSKEIVIVITIIGKTISKNIGKRKNAREGDSVFVTGKLGDKKTWKKPVPQIEKGQKIVKLTKRVALMDSSDGLADCLIQISDQSKVKIIIDENKIPAAKSLKDTLYAGEDYQLAGTASKSDCKKLLKNKIIKIIGEVLKGKNAFLKQKNSRLVKLDMKKSYEHFA